MLTMAASACTGPDGSPTPTSATGAAAGSAIDATPGRARVEGAWSITLEVSAQKPTANTPEASQAWSFGPDCETGVCGVTVTGSLDYKNGDSYEVYVPLAKLGSRYLGAQEAAPLGCRTGASTAGTLSIRVTVTAQESVDGQIRATAIEGSGRCASSESNEFQFTLSGVPA
jgi:hypothetical protein